jgi:F0F1-type ATP synthase assembly protein I
MGTEFAGALCGLTLLGYWIDRHYETGIKATLICSGVGLVGGMYNFIRQAVALSKETQQDANHEFHEHVHRVQQGDHDAHGKRREP